MSRLKEKAMLVSLNIRQWDARRFDYSATRDILTARKARPGSGRFNKILVDLAAVKRYQRAANNARTFHYDNTLPWQDEGARILPAANYLPYMQAMRKLKTDFEAARDEFISEYPALVNQAAQDLGGLFDSRDYPSAHEIKYKFDFSVHVLPLPDAVDFRISLSDNETEKIKADITRQVEDSIHNAIENLWHRLHEAIGHLTEKLQDKDAIFRDSIIGNIKELTDILPKLNITDNPDLNKIIDETRQKLASLDPDNLRQVPKDRKAAAQKAQEILDKMSGYMGSQ